MASKLVKQANSARPRFKRIVRTAYHEAGHACVAAALIGMPEEVTIKRTGQRLGNCAVKISPFANQEFLAQFSLAGFAAEHLLARRMPVKLKLFTVDSDALLSVVEGHDDLSDVAAAVRRLHGVRSHNGRIRWVMHYYAIARDSIQASWPTVERLASKLLTQVTLDREKLIGTIDDVYSPIFEVQKAYGVWPPNR